ncbi:DNA polymerase III subunit delta [Blochmannia endosymbiont of Polyrhachis (Hedomyrma) turneri]|uniref:DNA polymerase III subunit delta n=1 Tax=Blochmannia endosymbiont of Polyrhachis (Hedomyrma) turneri TaxID=1505596 RepID=UPI00061A6CEC|nr:DNA polymerase III subunit delta [Blochmannia endosymbiont of Polyrhachis (Hedomyrma) turneri]AKC59882.1 DNA polymerase III subunit delta [Blochmannia endosymbiont of Polyrhachis (Hedomyrma) turneri]
MITHICLQQLQQQISIKKTCYYCYVIFGNNQFLLNDTQDFILKNLTSPHSYDQFVFSLNDQSTLNDIFEIAHTQSLFKCKKKIFLLYQTNKKIDNTIFKKISFLIPLMNHNLFLIFRINTLTIAIKNYFHSYKNLRKHIVFIECNTPQYNRLIPWILQRAKDLNFTLNQSSCELLSSYYEDDLNALHQILYQLSIIYPKQNLDIIHIKDLMNDTSSYFHISHLLGTILKYDKKRFERILNKLQAENTTKPLTVLRSIQNLITLLIMCKRTLSGKNHSLISSLLNKYKIQKSLHLLFIKKLNHITLKKLYLTITLLLQTELMIYQERTFIIWNNLKAVILLLSDDINHH